MFYEINVSLNGLHLFATSERSIQNELRAIEIVKLFKEKFPESEGYEIMLTQWKTTGRKIEI